MIRYKQFDFSGGVQNATSWLLKKANELYNIRNGSLSEEVGSIRRRLGTQRVGSIFGAGSNNTPTGGFVANYSTGSKRFVALNDSTGTATIIRVQDSGAGTWTTLSTTIPANSKVFFFYYLDEVYITGYDSTGAPITPYNVDKTLDISTSRNILNMPKAYYLAEFNGALFAGNVTVGSTRYPNRAYKSSGPLGAITFVNAAQNGALTYIVVDSVRHLKAGMSIDIYTGGSETKKYDIDITSVDKVNNYVYFTGQSLTFATGAVNVSTNEITLSSAATYPTGTPIIFTSSGTVPAGLTSGTTYYSIYVNATTIKVATTAANATAGTVVDITSTGAGTHTIKLGYVLADNDELWLDGRKGKLTMFWNTDYPTTEDADWTATLPGADSSDAITAMAKSSNRLFLFTKNSGQKFDGVNTVTFNNAVGCVSQNSLKNIDDDWLVWIDANGKVWARNDTNAQQEYISRQIHNGLMKYLTGTNLSQSSAVAFEGKYKLWLGTVNSGYGDEKIRVVYSFDDNSWTVERHSQNAVIQAVDDYTGVKRPYFFSDDGYLYVDEIGNLDHDKVIPLEVETGRDNFGSEQLKKFDAMLIYSEASIGSSIKVSIDNSDFITVGQITSGVQYIKMPERGSGKPPIGTSVSCKILNASAGDPPVIQGIVWYYDIQEDIPGARR